MARTKTKATVIVRDYARDKVFHRVEVSGRGPDNTQRQCEQGELTFNVAKSVFVTVPFGTGKSRPAAFKAADIANEWIEANVTWVERKARAGQRRGASGLPL